MGGESARVFCSSPVSRPGSVRVRRPEQNGMGGRSARVGRPEQNGMSEANARVGRPEQSGMSEANARVRRPERSTIEGDPRGTGRTGNEMTRGKPTL
jgi:hypothetical protein